MPGNINRKGAFYFHDHEEAVTIPLYCGKPVAISFWSESPSGAEACRRLRGTNDVSWLTSVPCSIFSLMLLRGQIKETCVFPPEVLDADAIGIFLEGIKTYGIDVVKKVIAA